MPNGIDIDQTQSAPLPADHAEPGFDVLFAGRLIADKSLDVPLEAFDTVVSALDAALSGQTPPCDPEERTRPYDWEEVTDQMEEAYERAIGNTWRLIG